MLIPGHVWTMWKTISEAQPGPAVHFSFLSMCLYQWGSQPSVQAAATFLATNSLTLVWGVDWTDIYNAIPRHLLDAILGERREAVMLSISEVSIRKRGGYIEK